MGGVSLNYVFTHRLDRQLHVLAHACTYTLVFINCKGFFQNQTKDIAHLFIQALKNSTEVWSCNTLKKKNVKNLFFLLSTCLGHSSLSCGSAMDSHICSQEEVLKSLFLIKNMPF